MKGNKQPEVNLSGRRVLVTGGTGFIGGRLVEQLIRVHGAEVRVLVRNFSHVSRVARFDVEMVGGSVVNAGDVERAAADCDIIIHCAYGTEGGPTQLREATVDGTRHVLEAARRGGQRVVHVSTISVYGATPDGPLDETAPRNPAGDHYGETKLEAENLALEYAAAHGVGVAVVQPTVVYGPFGFAWTVRILNDLEQGRVILVDGGEGLCNLVYVDDVVDGMVRAAVEPAAIGQVMLLSGDEPVTWRTFYERHAQMLGVDGTVTMTAAEARAYFEQKFHKKRRSLMTEAMRILRDERTVRQRVAATREVNALRVVARKVVPQALRRGARGQIVVPEKSHDNGGVASAAPERPIHPLPPSQIDFHAAKTRVCIDKARRLIGYEPAFDFESGMARTEAWARWARHLDT